MQKEVKLNAAESTKLRACEDYANRRIGLIYQIGIAINQCRGHRPSASATRKEPEAKFAVGLDTD